MKNVPPLHLLIKPASDGCNMACRYCFYRDEAENRQVPSYGRMSEETLETVVRRAFDYAERECTFAFQGGEPTLAGLPFFRKLVELVKQYNTKKIRVHYAIQTNGYVIDREWAEFFRENRFLVGLSLDGNKEVHDRFRPDRTGKGTFSKAMHAAQLFDACGVDYNILTVVTKQLAQNIQKVYSFYARNGFRFQQYIPCLDAIGEERGGQEYSLTPEVYGKFLIELFELWYRDRKQGKQVSIRYFDNLLMVLRDTPPEACGMLGCCSVQNVVEADGEVYPCDFYVLDRYRLGNLKELDLAQIHENRKQSGFLQSSLVKPEECQTCRWKSLCRGGCRRDRDQFDGGDPGLNYFCKAYQQFFDAAFPRLRELAYTNINRLF